MKRILQYVWLLAILCPLAGCQGTFKSPNLDVTSEQNKSQKTNPIENVHPSNSKTDVYTQAAIETCNCIQPMVEKAKHLKELETNKQTAGMKKVASEMAQIQPQVQKCSDAIRKKYSKINNAIDEKRILNALASECPDMATLFSNLAKLANE